MQVTAYAMIGGNEDQGRESLWEEHFKDLLSQPLMTEGMPSLDDVMVLSRAERED